ncbi:AfsR/SARP family transcriptional regulator [Paenibacillus contaminans]|nr:bacterial transcriptional activator domain-containing protein [Paenibacillus contaminans]
MPIRVVEYVKQNGMGSTRGEKPLLEAVGKLLASKRFDEAIFQLECLSANGTFVPAQLLAQIPSKLLVKSPVLLHAYAEHLTGQGKLALAKTYALLAVKTFLEQGLSASFQASCALLATIHARLGELSEAEVVLLQLHDENLRADEGQSGSVLLALAELGHLIGLEESRSAERYCQAILLFEREGQPRLACTAAFCRLFAGVYTMDCGVWEDGLSDLRRKLNGSGLAGEFDSRLLLLECAYASRSGNWDYLLELERGRATADVKELDYYHAAYLQLLVLRAKLRTGKLADTQTIDEWEHEASDVRMLWLYSCAKLEVSLAAKDDRQTKRWKERLSSLRANGGAPPPIERLALSLERDAERNIMQTDDHSAAVRTSIPWKVRCFGGFGFFREGQEVQRLVWKRKKAFELFLFLLLQPGYAAPKDQVASLLFNGDENEGNKVSNQIYVCVHQIRQTAERFLGLEQAVVVKDGIVRLSEAGFDYVDVEKYRTLVKVGENLWGSGERELALELMEEASQLYGELLPASLNADWLELVREQLSDYQEGLLHKLWDAAYGARQYDRAETVAKAWIRLVPFKEQAYHAMIRSVYELGRKNEAKEWYGRLEAMCRDEYGVMPDPGLRTKLFG